MKFIDPYGLKERFNLKLSEFTDSRDGIKYKTIIIDEIEWFLENLNYDIYEEYGGKSFVELFHKSSPSFQHHSKTECGHFYDFDSAKMACPPGWEVPSRDIFVELFKKITDLSPNEWDRKEKIKIYHSVKLLLQPSFCGRFERTTYSPEARFSNVSKQATFFTSTPGSMANGGSFFSFQGTNKTYIEGVGYDYYSVRPIRKKL